MSYRTRYSVWLAQLWLLTPVAHAQHSYFEWVKGSDGTASPVAALGLAQDSTGFIWIGHSDGLWRYDGRNFVHWHARDFDDPVHDMVATRGGEIFVRTFHGHGYFKTETGLTQLLGPAGERVTNLTHMAYDGEDRLWCVLGDELWRRERNGSWTQIPPSRFNRETPLRLATLDEGVGLMTNAGAWWLQDRASEHLVASKDVYAMAGGGKHPIWIARHFCPENGKTAGLWRYQEHTAQSVACDAGRVMDMRYRNDTLWLSVDKGLFAFEPDGRRRGITVRDGLTGGPLLIDREGSLWLGAFQGLAHFPEPDTWHWYLNDGLPEPFGYWITYGAHRVWMSIWGYVLASFAEDGSDLRIEKEIKHYGVPCVDAEDRIWASDRDDLWRRDGDEFHKVDVPSGAPGWLLRCLSDRENNLWMLMRNGVYRLAAQAEVPERVLPVDADREFETGWIGDDDSLWLANAREACHYTRDGRVALKAAGCVSLATPRISGMLDALPVAPGRVWLACNTCAFEFDGRSAQALPSSHIAAGAIFLPARSGGYWIKGRRVRLGRVRPCLECDGGFEALETPGAWQGLPSIDGYAVETPSGDLWVNSGGVYRVPAAARTLPSAAPRVLPVRVLVDGADKPLDRALEVGLEQHSIGVEFAALTYRDRSLLRYRWRLHPSDQWSDSHEDGTLQLIDPPYGSYHIALQASLDGVHWSEPPGTIDFVVATPWYRKSWAYAMFALFGASLLALAYRQRVASILRVERERTRIAMDLHDDLGSGLGAINMLAAVAAREETNTEERRRAAAQIAQTTSLLGGGLRTLVWSMKSGRADLASLATQLSDHARRLLPDSSPRLTVKLPASYPTDAVEPEVRRHVLLIALEALHNAARHAKAGNVVVRLAPEGVRWLLEIIDDGVGFDVVAENCGNGLDSMRRRARLIDAELTVSASSAGTSIRLSFAPFAKHVRNRIFMRLRWRRGTHKLAP